MLFLLSCIKQYTLELDVVPPEGTILINDLPSCSERPCVLTLPKAQYQITVLAPGYAAQHMDLLLTKNEKHLFSLEAQRGELYVESAPTNLLINVDGQIRGNTPLALSLSKGSHKIWIQDSCFVHQEQEYQVEVGERQEVLLRPTAKHQRRRIDVEAAKPGEAAILTDGRFVGYAPFDGEIPACTRAITAIWNDKVGSVSLSEVSSEDIVIVVHEVPKAEEVPSLLGFIPPICRTTTGVDAHCMDTWLKEKKREFDKRNSHTHHEGCAH